MNVLFQANFIILFSFLIAPYFRIALQWGQCRSAAIDTLSTLKLDYKHCA